MKNEFLGKTKKEKRASHRDRNVDACLLYRKTAADLLIIAKCHGETTSCGENGHGGVSALNLHHHGARRCFLHRTARLIHVCIINAGMSRGKDKSFGQCEMKRRSAIMRGEGGRNNEKQKSRGEK